MDKDDLYELLKANKIEFKIFDHEPQLKTQKT